MLLEPYETSGSGTPVSGARPSTAKMFSSACETISTVDAHGDQAA